MLEIIGRGKHPETLLRCTNPPDRQSLFFTNPFDAFALFSYFLSTYSVCTMLKPDCIHHISFLPSRITATIVFKGRLSVP